jgi:choline dehydrogenase-like flavoprotein
MATQSEQPHYDVVVVGGGVAGAIMARRLSRKGKRVLVLEAGRGDAQEPHDYRSYLAKYFSMGLGRSAPNGPYPVNPHAPSPNDSNGTPYYVQRSDKTQFLSDYLRMLGGTTLHWQGTSLRMLPNDFTLQSTYGQALDWPICYADLEPYYCQAEEELGVSADVDEQKHLGQWFKDDYVYPMSKLPASVLDQFLDKRLQGATVELEGGTYPVRVTGIPVARNSIPNPAFDGGKGYEPVGSVGEPELGGRCQGNSSCTPLCPVQAKYNALKTMTAAVKQGGVTISNRSVASRLLFDPASGRITGVEYKRYEDPSRALAAMEIARGTIVVLTANAIENATLMLASQLKDESGLLGRNLMDHPYINFFGLAPEPVYPMRGPDTTSSIESLRDGEFRKRHAGIRSGIGNWGWGGQPKKTVCDLLAKKQFGSAFRSQLCGVLTRMVKLGMMIEQLPDPNNRVTIDPAYKDQLDNFRPVLTYGYADYTLDAAVATMTVVWPRVVQSASLKDEVYPAPGTQEIDYKGHTIRLAGSGHLVGTHRMGSSRATSVVDENLRSWSHSNLYVVGAGSMVTIGTSNPTLTVAALSFRAADHIVTLLNNEPFQII